MQPRLRRGLSRSTVQHLIDDAQRHIVDQPAPQVTEQSAGVAIHRAREMSDAVQSLTAQILKRPN